MKKLKQLWNRYSLEISVIIAILSAICFIWVKTLIEAL